MSVHIDSDDIRALGGYCMVPRFVMRIPGLSHGAKLLYGVLLSAGFEDDQPMDQERLANELMVKDRQVRNLLGELRDAALVNVERQGLGRPNVYVVLMPDCAGPDRQLSAGPEKQLSASPSIMSRIQEYKTPRETGNEQTSPSDKKGKVERSRSKKRSASPKKKIANWVSRYGDKLLEHTDADRTTIYKQVGAHLKDLHDRLGDEVLWPRWAHFCEKCDAKYLYPSHFAKNCTKWIPPAARPVGRPTGANGSTLREIAEAPDPYAGMSAKERFFAKHGDRIQQ